MKTYDSNELLQKDDTDIEEQANAPSSKPAGVIQEKAQTLKLQPVKPNVTLTKPTVTPDKKAVDKNKDATDYGNKLGKSIATWLIIAGITMAFVLGVLTGRFMIMNEMSNKPPKSSTNDIASGVKVVFTEINENTYQVNAGDAMQISCNSDNATLNMKIEYAFDDKTTGQSLYSTILNAGETLDFVPSNYFEGTHDIVITQNAYATSDSVGTEILATHYSNVKITINTDVDTSDTTE